MFNTILFALVVLLTVALFHDQTRNAVRAITCGVVGYALCCVIMFTMLIQLGLSAMIIALANLTTPGEFAGDFKVAHERIDDEFSELLFTTLDYLRA